MILNRKWILGIVVLLSSLIFAQGSPNVPLLANVDQYPGIGYNECWGYTAPDGREYAFLGIINGTSILDITDAPIVTEIAFIPGPSSSWKDMKTYQHYAYVVTESNGGMQIIDLSDLPNSATLINTYTGFSTSHNIYIDTENGYLYSEGSFSEPVRVFSLADPLNPQQVSFLGIESHDVYVRDNTLYVSEGTQGSFGIYDVSNPANPTLTNRVVAPAAGYAHNAWSTEDNLFLMTTEETSGKTIKMWDMTNPGNIFISDEILGPSGNIAHNTHIKGDFAYVSHYVDGLRIYDVSDPYNLQEVGFYDTFSGPGGNFSGAWGAYPFFPSGKVLISDRSTGLYVVFFQGAQEADLLDPREPTAASAYSDYNSPNAITLGWTDPANLVNGDTLMPGDFTIEVNRDGAVVASVNGGIESFTDSGLNDGQVYTYTLMTRVTASDSLSRESREFNWIAGGSPMPGEPQNLSCVVTQTAASLTWDDPTVQQDGTPLDDLAMIKIYRDGVEITSVAPGLQSYVDAPGPGIFEYQVTAVDNETAANESEFSNLVSCFVGAPVLAVSSDSIVIAVQPGNSDSTSIILSNNGASVLDYVIQDEDVLLKNRRTNEDQQNYPLHYFGQHFEKGEDDLRRGMSPLGSGGPDNFGHRWIDSDEPGGPQFNWQDISGSGTTVSLSDDSSIDVALEFPFSFYGNIKNTITISSNGYVTFGVDGTDFSNDPITDATNPNDIIAPFWDDLDPSRGGTIHYLSSPNEFIVQYTDIERYNGSSTKTFQVIIRANGQMLFQYLSMNSELESATIGIENSDASDGLEVVFNAPYVHDNLAVLILADSPWLSVSPNSGSISDGDAEAIAVFVASDGLAEGQYEGRLTINSNDPANAEAYVAVTLIVSSTVDIGPIGIADGFALKQNYPNPFNPKTVIRYSLSVDRVATLKIYDVTGRAVRTLVNERQQVGSYSVEWDGRNDVGETVGSGVYFYRLSAGQQQLTRRMLLLK